MTTQRIFTTFSGWPLRLACLGLSLAPLAPAFAVDGTITINGEIIEQTCKINGSTPPAHILVNLPKISTTALKAKGDIAGSTAFVIKLTECPASLSGEVKAYFEPGPTTDYDTGNLYAYKNTSAAAKEMASDIPESQASQGKADNVEIQLANPDGTPITIGASKNNAQGVTLSSNAATLRYLARYYRSGTEAVSSGKLYTYVQYSIVYP
ncbi:fimbrial protein [Bordetella trematum]|uniref:fimbrial protein n=1 Tax=Bordetella trematum TaxID=123899 RepID=UPI0009DE244C|nr:fimbrial protein [Bordetella trematum]QIM70466.1 fimbrial protein [Bordetella trematum]